MRRVAGGAEGAEVDGDPLGYAELHATLRRNTRGEGRVKPQPITKQRSPWGEIPVPVQLRMQYSAVRGLAAWERRVHDGVLIALVGQEPLGAGGSREWHLSISFRDHRGELTRYPTWDEIAHARSELLPDDLEFVMHLPPLDRYVALHDTTFHLHEYHRGEETERRTDDQ